jgi:hypothetical protein
MPNSMGGHQALVGNPLRQRQLGGSGVGHCSTGGGFIQGTVLHKASGDAGDTDQIGVAGNYSVHGYSCL